MSKQNDGGAAFPVHAGVNPTGVFSGMKLRDWFAGQALTSGRVLFGSNIRNAEDLAKDMYEIADAMLKEREK